MEINEIINYVMNTPTNSNPAVLRSMLTTLAEGGSSGLPEVSESDNGDVLTVVEGAWAKATPSGGGSNVLVVNYTATMDGDDITITGSDKTYAEIYQAYQDGAYILAKILGTFIPCTLVNETEVGYNDVSAQITSEDVTVTTLEIQHTSEDTLAAWIHTAVSGGSGRDFLINFDPLGPSGSILEGTYDGLYAKLSQGVPVFGSVVSAGVGATMYSSEVLSVEINSEVNPATIWINIRVSGADVSLEWASDDTISIAANQ